VPTATPSFTQTSTLTATFTSTSLPTATLDPKCGRAGFVSDITVPDGTIINATEKFTKTWRFKNIGSCTWTTSYKFVFIGGDKMDALDSISLPNNVAPGETIDISITLTAPENPGTYKGNWSFEDNIGKQFGLGSSGTGQIWVQVKVVATPTNTPTVSPEFTQTITSTAEPTQEATREPTAVVPSNTRQVEILAYDFVSEICSAQWLISNVQQPCPGSGSEAQKFINLVTLPTLEDGTTLNNPAILIGPDNTNGSSQGIYPEFLVQDGDHFRAIASCEANSTTCSALFRVSYQDASNAIVDLWAVGEFYDQKYTQIDVDLSALAGQKIKFILDVTPLNTDPTNHVFWASPGIYREPLPTATSTITPTVTATITPIPTATVLPSPTVSPTPAPQTETETLTTFEKIQKFFTDIFKNIFGG
jgi:hypothetical protein